MLILILAFVLVLIIGAGVVTDISGFAGSVTLAGHGGDAFAWTLNSRTAIKNTGRYASGSRFVRKRGGVIEMTGTVSVFLTKGSGGSAPNLVAPAVDGDAMTLQADAGCTYAGTAIIGGSINHRFDDPAVEATYNFEFTGTVSETWATT